MDLIRKKNLILLLLAIFSKFSTVFGSDGGYKKQKPNVVVIMADDLGWNDVSFHGSDEIPTPNIDSLAYSGIILNRFYAAPLCTPSRSAFLTGKYSNNVGMQSVVILNDSPFGLPTNETIMPQYFKTVGYKTYLIGKWHQGFYQKQYIPTVRGFDSFYGYYGGYIDYYSHTVKMFDKNYSRGLDMRRNSNLDWSVNGTYATDLFTDEAVNTINKHNYKTNPLFLLLTHLAPHAGNEDFPLEAPQSEIDKFKHIPNQDRRTLAAMISKLDQGVGKVVKALKDKGVLQNTIILFYSDNGGPTVGVHSTQASNYPLRGQKGSGWEGSVRTVGMIYSPLIKNKNQISNQMFHITDILPTLARAAGFKITQPIDGVDQWDTLSKGSATKRSEIFHINDPVFQYSAYTKGSFKIIDRTVNGGIYDGWIGETNNTDYRMKNYYETLTSSDTYKAIQCLESRPPFEKCYMLETREEMRVKCKPKWMNYTKCEPLVKPCLFDIIDDPCEQDNLANSNPTKMKEMQMELAKKIAKSLPPRYKGPDVNCDPIKHNFTWTWWQPDSH